MHRIQLFLALIFTLIFSSNSLAQTTTTDPASTLNWFYTACENRIVIDLSGKMQSGYDVYFQAFAGFGGTGEALTGLRQVSVSGDFSVSQVANYINGQTKVLGQPVSVVLRMARESDPESTIFKEAADDFTTACKEPASSLGTSTDLTSGEFQVGQIVSSAKIWTPDGGVLNPVYYVAPEPIVKIGARASDTIVPGRTANPGLIFAECTGVKGGDPGVIYDTDEITVFWSWFAKTPAQVQAHIDNAQYAITLNGQTLPDVQVSAIRKQAGSANYWVFYVAHLGDKWKPDGYGINFHLTWANPIFDGYDNYGPGTDNEALDGGCFFEVLTNPYGTKVVHENPAFPLKSY